MVRRADASARLVRVRLVRPCIAAALVGLVRLAWSRLAMLGADCCGGGWDARENCHRLTRRCEPGRVESRGIWAAWAAEEGAAVAC